MQQDNVQPLGALSLPPELELLSLQLLPPDGALLLRLRHLHEAPAPTVEVDVRKLFAHWWQVPFRVPSVLRF